MLMSVSLLIPLVLSDSVCTCSHSSFPYFVSFLSPLLCSFVCWCDSCCHAGWRSLGLVHQTSPSPREVALTTHPPTPLSLMTLLRPLPAGQTLLRAELCMHKLIHTKNCMYCFSLQPHPRAYCHSLHQRVVVDVFSPVFLCSVTSFSSLL